MRNYIHVIDELSMRWILLSYLKLYASSLIFTYQYPIAQYTF